MEVHDLVIVGAGSAGLSAAINGASELASVALFDSGKKDASGVRQAIIGGQAIGSTSIENYAGFPDGVTGIDLIDRFQRQALKFGTKLYCPNRVESISLNPNGTKTLVTKEGLEVSAKAVVVASGLSYKKLAAPGVIEFLGRGVLYGAPTSNPNELGDCTVCVVGAANSAGQAVLHLAKNPRIKIKVLVRSTEGLEVSMSQYLLDRIKQLPNVEVLTGVEVTKVSGSDFLSEIELTHQTDKTKSTLLCTQHLFIFIGAVPKVEWLEGKVVMDPKKFIVTGVELGTFNGKRRPFETSMPGVFAAGDIRFGSIKRVASAVGEGAQAVSWVHNYVSGESF